MWSIEELEDGGYALAGQITEGSDKDLLLIKLDSDLQYCGSLTYTSSNLDITDITDNPSLIFTTVIFS